jgi:DNA-binding MarR family transcriptional regulator
VQWDALRHIARHPDSSSHELAQLTFQTDQSFGALAARLAGQGLIERKAGPGRAIRHRLTPAGEKLLLAGNAVVDEVLAESFSALTLADRKALHELLLRLLSAPLAASNLDGPLSSRDEEG